MPRASAPILDLAVSVDESRRTRAAAGRAVGRPGDDPGGRRFSCREQIALATDRQALHTAQVVRLAQARGNVPRAFPEREVVIDDAARTADRLPAYAAAALIGVGAVLALRGVPFRRT